MKTQAKWRNTTLLAVALFMAIGTGCRGLSVGGDMIPDRHVLRGRAAPELQASEIRAGTYESQDPHLAPCRASSGTWVASSA